MWSAQAELKTAQPSESKPSHVFTDLRRFKIPIDAEQNDRSEAKMVTESSKSSRDILDSANIADLPGEDLILIYGAVKLNSVNSTKPALSMRSAETETIIPGTFRLLSPVLSSKDRRQSMSAVIPRLWRVPPLKLSRRNCADSFDFTGKDTRDQILEARIVTQRV